ncbi:MAG: hypothetical protein CFE21_11830 [Bacteroidetes bacterium B1(2017)]|nr:MAG: hypothetical protein CFE21_11830 [Bacteroidetes bacterium B1(2017)]
MQKTIILYLIILLAPLKNFGQQINTCNILLTAINNRNNHSDLSANVSYNFKSFGDNKIKEMEYIINQLKDDSFYFEIKSKSNLKVKEIIYERGDSSNLFSLDLENGTFAVYGVRIKNNKRNCHVIKRVFGRYYDSSSVNSLLIMPKDTIIYNVPCWELVQRPSVNPVSRVIASSIYVSKGDYLIRGFREEEIYEDLDTVITCSFIKNISFDPKEIRNNIAKVENEISFIKSKYNQEPINSFHLDKQAYSGFIDKVKGLSINQNDSINLDFKKGKYLLDFWFIGCYPCMQSFPYIDSLENKYSPNGIHFIKLNPLNGNDPDKAKRYCKLHNLADENYLIARSLCSNFDVNSFPSFVFIEDGKIIKKFTGFDESIYDDLKLFLEKWTSDLR